MENILVTLEQESIYGTILRAKGMVAAEADEVFTSWGCETTRKYTKEQVENILVTLEQESIYGTILRAKGMVAAEAGEWIYFDFVPEEYEIRSGAPEYTGRICVIGSQLEEQKLKELFEV